MILEVSIVGVDPINPLNTVITMLVLVTLVQKMLDDCYCYYGTAIILCCTTTVYRVCQKFPANFDAL